MKWIGREESENVEDRRGVSGRQMAAGGGGLAIIIALIGWLLGGDPQQFFDSISQSSQTSSTNTVVSAQEDTLNHFVRVVLADNEKVWGTLFANSNLQYQKPTLVLFRTSTQSPCGSASAQTGPFYCPADQKVYLDLGFFDEMQNHLGAHGKFALAYVVSHEVGHHVQYLLGTTQKIQSMRERSNEVNSNRLSVAMELQADFYAGVWAHYNQTINGVLEQGDIEEALGAANAVGDDRLQKRSQGYVVPDAFTHGTSEQRMYWFKLGYTSGDMNLGNTFKGMF